MSGTSCHVWLGIILPATQTALPGTSGFAEGSAISVNMLVSPETNPVSPQQTSLNLQRQSTKSQRKRKQQRHAQLCYILWLPSEVEEPATSAAACAYMCWVEFCSVREFVGQTQRAKKA
ncbi:hypothetical protein WJX77_002277 [Trebouxia sp. C0004]